MYRRSGESRFFDRFRAVIAEFSTEEEVLLKERTAAADMATNRLTANLGTMRDTEEWVTHTYKVIAEAKDILAAAVDMETGMRGYRWLKKRSSSSHT